MKQIPVGFLDGGAGLNRGQCFRDQNTGEAVDLPTILTSIDDNAAKEPALLMSAGAVANLSAVVVADFDGTAQGVTLVEGDSFVVKDTASPDGVISAAAKYNGIYVLGPVRAGVAVAVRRHDADTDAGVKSGLTVPISLGTYAGKIYMLTTANPIVLGTTALTFAAATSAASDGSTTTKGLTKMSVAPASAASPIAVGTNDPRVCTVEVQIDLAAADGSYVESSVWIPGVIGTITAASLSANANITQSDTDYVTYTLGIRDGAGGAASTVASKSTKTTGGGAFLAFQALTLGAITNPTTAAASQVTFKAVKSGAGQASTGPALLKITYSVP